MTDDTKPLEDTRDKQIEELKQAIATAENNLAEAKKALAALTGEEIPSFTSAKPSKASPFAGTTPNGKIVEGIFDGENMLGPDGKIYPVPANYASKSKLIEGDKLKLTIAEDGSFIFKQIGPAGRKKLIGELQLKNNVYTVLAEGKSYNVLYASVTYFKAKAGDRVTIVVPADEDTKWAAIENIIHELPKEPIGDTRDKEDTIDLNEKVEHTAFLEPEVPSVDGIAPVTEATATSPQINSVPPEEAPMDVPLAAQMSGLPEFPDFEEKVPEKNTVSPAIPNPDNVFGTVPATQAPAPETAEVVTKSAPAQPIDEIEI